MKTAHAIAREIQRADICVEETLWAGWEAVDLNTYEPGDHIGYGRTPLDAIVDLLDKKEEG